MDRWNRFCKWFYGTILWDIIDYGTIPPKGMPKFENPPPPPEKKPFTRADFIKAKKILDKAAIKPDKIIVENFGSGPNPVSNSMVLCFHPSDRLKFIAYDNGQAMFICGYCDANIFKQLEKQ